MKENRNLQERAEDLKQAAREYDVASQNWKVACTEVEKASERLREANSEWKKAIKGEDRVH